MEVLDAGSVPSGGMILAEAQWGPGTTHFPVLSQMKDLCGMCFPVFFCLLALLVFFPHVTQTQIEMKGGSLLVCKSLDPT